MEFASELKQLMYVCLVPFCVATCSGSGLPLCRRYKLFSYVRTRACVYTIQHISLSTFCISGYLKKTQSTAFYMPPNVSFKISLNSAAFVSCKSPAKIGFYTNFSVHLTSNDWVFKNYSNYRGKNEFRKIFLAFIAKIIFSVISLGRKQKITWLKIFIFVCAQCRKK